MKRTTSPILNAILLLSILLSAGCSSTKPPPSLPPDLPPESDYSHYEGPPELKWPLRQELERQFSLDFIDADADRVKDMSIIAERGEPAGRSPDGYYGPLPGTEDNVHAAVWTAPGSLTARFIFFYPEGEFPLDWHIPHECGHVTLVSLYGTGGHPDTFTPHDGVERPIADLIGGGVRWPARVWRTVKDYVTFWSPREGDGFTDAVNGNTLEGGFNK